MSRLENSIVRHDVSRVVLSPSVDLASEFLFKAAHINERSCRQSLVVLNAVDVVVAQGFFKKHVFFIHLKIVVKFRESPI